jgi:hypothetical protein
MTTVRRRVGTRRPLAATALLAALAAPLAAQSGDLAARPPASPPGAPAPPTEQLEAMAKLRYLVGEWRGAGWIEMQPGRRLEFRGGERVQEKLGGLALLVEGRFTATPPGATQEVPVHTTLAVISYDPRAKKYLFDTWLATGTSGDHELVLTESGWHWEIRHPGGVVRYTFHRGPQGEWIEIGERSADGTTWSKFFEMTLRKEP